MNGIENGIKRDPMRFFHVAKYKTKTVGYPFSVRYDHSVSDYPADICELFADIFESGYNAEDVSNSSDGCGFSVSDLEAAICGLNANKGPENYGVPPSFVKLCVVGLKSPLLHIFYLSFSIGTFPSKWKEQNLENSVQRSPNQTG
jgi:hypothetical protein